MSHVCGIEQLESRMLLASGWLIVGGGPVDVRVFNDLNGDGARNANEPWMAGIPVIEMYEVLGNSGGPAPNLAYTDAVGRVTFGGQNPVDSINAGAVRNYRQSTPQPLRIRDAHDNLVEMEIGLTSRALASGKLMDDLNGNGRVDADDVPIPGRTIFDDLNNNGVADANEQSVTTDHLGRWTFNSLPAGTHNLRLRSNGAAQTAPVNNGTINLTLARGQTSVNNLFASRGAVVHGTIFNDLNGDGVRSAGEVGAGNAFVFSDANGNGVWDSSETSTRSAADGTWVLAGLAAGATTIRVAARSDYPLTLGANGVAINARLDAAASASFAEQGVLITGRAYFDVNGSGAYDADDFAASQVWLDANNNGKHDAGELAATLSSSGLYSFADLPAGTYTVRAQASDTFSGFKTIQMQPTPHVGSAWQFTLVPGEARVHRDFVFQASINITASVFLDRNLNGRMDGDEYLVGALTVYLDLDNDGSLDNNEPSQLTSDSDPVTFRNLRPGTYVVRVASPDGWRFNGAGNAQTLTQNVGTHSANATFGGRAGQISGALFYDADADGAYDNDDLPAGDAMQVYIDFNDDGVEDGNDIDAKSFGSTGYIFDGLSPGHYVVRFSLVTEIGVPSAVGADRAEFDLGSGQSLTHNFACVAPVVYSGTIFNDVNGNGVYDGAGETMNYTFIVYIDENNDGQREPDEPEAFSDSGAWSIPSSPGRAVLRVQIADGWHQELPAAGYIAHNLSAGQASKNNVFAVQRD